MSTQKITSGSVTYFVCECGNPPQYCKCSELARIAHLEQQAARLANLPEGWEVETIKPYSGISEVTQPECRRLSQIFSETKTMTCGEFQFLLKLLNACYPPAPATGQEEGKA